MFDIVLVWVLDSKSIDNYFKKLHRLTLMQLFSFRKIKIKIFCVFCFFAIYILTMKASLQQSVGSPALVSAALQPSLVLG